MDVMQSLLSAVLGGIAALVSQRVIRSQTCGKQAPELPSSDDKTDHNVKEESSVKLWTGPPHPDWHPGKNQPPPDSVKSSPTREIDPDITPAAQLYSLCISAIIPRPIAFVSTVGSNGEGNLAPYSYFNVMSHDPPHVVIGCCATGTREHGRKDTLVNILETKEFVVNIISDWFVESANHCCGNFDYGSNEMDIVGLSPSPSLKVVPPGVAESAVRLECRLAHTFEVRNMSGKATSTIVIGKVVMMHVSEGVGGTSPTGKFIVDVGKLRPVSRLGGNTYGQSYGLFDLPRPDRTT